MSFDLPSQLYNPSLGSSPRTHPYAPSLSSSASSSSSSVFSVDAAASDVSSQSSSGSSRSWEAEQSWEPRQSVADCHDIKRITRVQTFPQYQPARCHNVAAQRILPPLRTTNLAVPLEQRQHPRRSASHTNLRAPPALVRQSERKVNFVDSLVVSATQMVEVIWPLSVPTCPGESSGRVLPLRTFIQETLRRSRTSYSTLQVALYYLILIKSHVPKHDFTMVQPDDTQSSRALQCGRRMFLAALILASKYLQDRNFSSSAWSKISGLGVCEINSNEMAFLHAVNWKLHITELVFERWQQVVLKYTPQQPPTSPGGMINGPVNAWRGVIPLLTPELDTIDLQTQPRTPVRCSPPENNCFSRSPLRMSSTSQESTPTPVEYKLPRFLEPKPDMLPPTPSLARMGPLPTPLLTPQSATSYTPAVSGMAFAGSRRPSMCSAMAQAQNTGFMRSTLDWNSWNPAACSSLSRRPSMSMSTSSSPESMISDAATRSSRSSSISSISSAAAWAPCSANLARLATCRNARLPYPGMPPKRKSSVEGAINEVVTPDLSDFCIVDETLANLQVVEEDPITPSSVAPSEEGFNSRKRCRSSVDLSLQQNVRSFLAESGSPTPSPYVTVLPDRSLPKTFLSSADGTSLHLPLDHKALQSPSGPAQERRVPIQKDLGRKRWCATEAAQAMSALDRPGKWAGIL